MRKKVFYGWIICGVCALLLFVTMGTASNVLSVFMPFIMQDFHLSNTQTSSLVLVRSITSFISMLVIGKYYDLIGFRKGTGISVLFCAAAYVIYSFSEGYPGFCVGAAMAGISYGLGSMIPVSILVNQWFMKHRALCIGICGAGTSAATIVMPPILTGIVLRHSLQSAFYCVIAYVSIVAVLVFLLIRDHPGDMDLEPLGKEEALKAYQSREKTAAKPKTESYAFTLREWLLMGAASIMMGALANSGFLHLTVLYTGEGFPPMTVALFLSIAGIILTIFKIVFGEVADLLGGYKTSALFMGILFAGYGLCCLSFLGNTPLAMFDAVLLGIGYPIATIGIPVWSSELVSQDQYAAVVRRLQVSYAAGAMIFAGIPGAMADRFGSYIPVYMIFALLIGISFATVTISYRIAGKNGAHI